jgi:replication-associated recombination protein RarA
MRVKKKKDGSKTFTYSGDLEKEIEKVGKNLLKVEKELLFVDEAYLRVKKQRDSLLTKKENYRTFIRIGTEELNKEKS